MADLIGMGAALVDAVVTVDEAFLGQHGLQKGYMHLIDAAQAATIAQHISNPRMVSGGSAANTCVGYSLFGGSAGFMGRVASDALGDAFAASLSDAGVRYTNLKGTSDAASGVCYALVTPDGERTMCTFLGASGDFNADAIDAAMLQDARMLYLEGYIWDTVARAEAADRAISVVRRNGGQVGFSLSDGWVVGKHHAIFMHYLDKSAVDVLFANESEVLALPQCDDFAAAAVRAKTLAKTVVLTRSEKGALVIQGETAVDIAPVPIEKLIDATGAGDLFAAGFLYGYLNGLPVVRAGQLGAQAASAVITQLGARPVVDLKGLLQAA